MHSYPLIGLTTLVASMSLPPYQPAVSRFRNKGTLSRVVYATDVISCQPGPLVEITGLLNTGIRRSDCAQVITNSFIRLLMPAPRFLALSYTILLLRLATQLVFIPPRSLPVQVTYHARHYKQPLSDTFETKSYAHCNKIIHVDFVVSVLIVMQWWS